MEHVSDSSSPSPPLRDCERERDRERVNVLESMARACGEMDRARVLRDVLAFDFIGVSAFGGCVWEIESFILVVCMGLILFGFVLGLEVLLAALVL